MMMSLFQVINTKIGILPDFDWPESPIWRAVQLIYRCYTIIINPCPGIAPESKDSRAILCMISRASPEKDINGDIVSLHRVTA